MTATALRLVVIVCCSYASVVTATEPDRAEPITVAERPIYQSAGRRDPFLRATTFAGGRRACAGATLSGQPIAAVALRGVVTTRTGRVAFLSSADGRAYFARVGDRLCDGRVIAVEAASATFSMHDTEDLTGLRQREVRKSLSEP